MAANPSVLVMFYAPWCGHCKRAKPHFVSAAAKMKEAATPGSLAAVDCTVHQKLSKRFEVKGFPTIKYFRDGQLAFDVGDAREEAVILKFMSDPREPPPPPPPEVPWSDEESEVEHLDVETFKPYLKKKKHVLVIFYAPWCGHCKSLAGPWANAASQLKGKMDLGALDATAHGSIAQQYGVQGYPTIKYFAPGATEPEDYNGGRTASDIVKFAEEKFSENLAPPEVVQITSEASVSAGCENHPLCVVAFLPHILDCQSSCRNGHIEDMKKLGEKYKKKDWGWLWTEGMTQPDLEAAVEVGGFGYPALVVLR